MTTHSNPKPGERVLCVDPLGEFHPCVVIPTAEPFLATGRVRVRELGLSLAQPAECVVSREDVIRLH